MGSVDEVLKREPEIVHLSSVRIANPSGHVRTDPALSCFELANIGRAHARLLC
jgi:hypothetical protein